MPRNPDWTRDELILALNLYFEMNFARNRPETDPRFEALSAVLNTLPIRAEGVTRTAADIAMKLSVFLKFDEGFDGIGLTRAGPDDETVWKQFAGDPERLRRLAESIRQNASVLPMAGADTEPEEEFVVGRILTRIHIARERNATLNATKRRLVLKQTGKLACEICGFDFHEKYGPLGQDFAECHHVVAPDAVKASANTRLSDLAVVCANCHRMLHRLMARDQKLYAPEDLRKMVERKK